MEKNWEPPPYAWPSAFPVLSGTWYSPARSRTCCATSPKRIMPDAPIGFDESTPPEGFQGMSPSNAVAPASVSFQPSPSAQKPRFSNHIGSHHTNGTYTPP